jgi:plastocyanin
MSVRTSFATACLVIISICGWAQMTVLNGRVELRGASGAAAKDASNVVIWLTPLGNVHPNVSNSRSGAQAHPRLVQTGKHFEPHLLVVPVGTAVEFPNNDPFFHNVFSLFEGKRFDLGLYEAGSTRTVRFDKPGISYIFCNIHPEMSAVVIALSTPYYAVSNRDGEITIRDVTPGHYRLNVWTEGALSEELNRLSREIDIPEPDHSLGIIRIANQGQLHIGHKNKYGKDYDDHTPSTPGYAR